MPKPRLPDLFALASLSQLFFYVAVTREVREVPLRRLLEEDPPEVSRAGHTHQRNMNPCIRQQLFQSEPYNLGILTRPDSTLLDWYMDAANATGDNVDYNGFLEDKVSKARKRWFTSEAWDVRREFHANPCSHKNFSNREPQVAMYTSTGDMYTIHKSNPSKEMISWLIEGRKAVRNGTQESCCKSTTILFNRDASTPPMISHYLDPNHHQEHETLDLVSIKPTDSVHIPNGVAVMLPAIITSTFSPQNKNPSVIAIIHPIPLAATDHEMAKECKRCMRWNATRYLGAEMSREVNASSLEFKCFSNITCAWGPGLCEACLDGLFSGQPMPAWFDKFSMQDFGYAGIQANFTQGYKFFLQRRACNTFCSTAYQVWYSGIDAAGKMMDSSQSIPGVLLGRMFRSLKEFQFTFGLSSELLKSLSAFELV